jgi:uncharacterized membrane protein
MPKKRRKQHVQPSEDNQPPMRQGAVRQVSRQVTHIEQYCGPLPSPDLLREFDSVVPGCAERIIKMAEDQSTHRQFLERTVVVGDSKRANHGLWVGGVIAALFLAGSVFLIHEGHEWPGVALGSVDLVGIIGAFVYGTRSRRAERTEKAETMHPSQ